MNIPKSLNMSPPNTTAAERLILAHCLTVKDPLIPLADAGLAPDDFQNRIHKELFRIIQEELKHKSRPDTFQIAKNLAGDTSWEELGGMKYLDTILASIDSIYKVKNAAEALKEMSRRRILYNTCSSVALRAYSLQDDLDLMQTDIKDALDKVSSAGPSGDPEKPEQFISGYFAHLETIYKSKGLSGIPSPWDDLNRITAGFAQSEVCIIAGRPGNGKTAMALNIALFAATQNFVTGIFSLEMSRTLLTNRLFSSGARVPAQSFRTGNFSDEDWSNLYLFAEKFKDLPLLFYDKPGLKVSQFRDKCRLWKLKHGLDFAVIDYLQLLTPESKRENREREIAEISRQIKLTAVELNIPIVLLAQLNREADNGTPKLSHLRESGAVEQDADQVIFICPWEVDKTAKAQMVKIKVAKGRNSATGTFNLMYLKNYLQFAGYHQGEAY